MQNSSHSTKLSLKQQTQQLSSQPLMRMTKMQWITTDQCVSVGLRGVKVIMVRFSQSGFLIDLTSWTHMMTIAIAHRCYLTSWSMSISQVRLGMRVSVGLRGVKVIMIRFSQSGLLIDLTSWTHFVAYRCHLNSWSVHYGFGLVQLVQITGI